MSVETFVTKITVTNFFFGMCTACVRPVRAEGPPNMKSARIACPDCGGKLIGKRLVAVKTEERCDGSCETATGPHCSCACGGEGHGSAWSMTRRSTTNLRLEEAMDAWRVKQAKLEDQRKKRAEAAARRKVTAFENWAQDDAERAALIGHLRAEVEWPNLFLDDIAAKVRRHEILSDRQVDAAARAIGALAPAGAAPVAVDVPVPVGTTEIKGEIITVKRGRYGLDMVVADDRGFRVMGRYPKRFDGSRGDRVAFTADLIPGREVGFGFYKSASKIEVLAAA